MHKDRLTKSQVRKLEDSARNLAKENPVLDEHEIIDRVEKEIGLKVTITGNKNHLWFNVLNAYRSNGGKVILDDSILR